MKRIIRDRWLRADEVQRDNEIRRRVEQELPDLIARHHDRLIGDQMSIDSNKRSKEDITRVVRFSTPDGQEFASYEEAEQYWTAMRFLDTCFEDFWSTSERRALQTGDAKIDAREIIKAWEYYQVHYQSRLAFEAKAAK